MLLNLGIARVLGTQLVVLSSSGLDPVGFARVRKDVFMNVATCSANPPPLFLGEPVSHRIGIVVFSNVLSLTKCIGRAAGEQGQTAIYSTARVSQRRVRTCQGQTGIHHFALQSGECRSDPACLTLPAFVRLLLPGTHRLHGADPESKGTVEGSVRYVKHNALAGAAKSC